ncbi:MAG: TonB-dependent receptor, partial [Betaproteobacteria bacterium]|nr:TonB-dependent receptor [Betaproteobacteria bacterium]
MHRYFQHHSNQPKYFGSVGSAEFFERCRLGKQHLGGRFFLRQGTTNFSVFGSNTLSTANQFHMSVAARYNSSKVNNLDNLTNSNNAKIESILRADCSAILAANRPAWCVTGLATGRWPGTNNTLTASHSFHRINPAIGLSFTPHQGFNPYVSYSENSRAPTSIELGCA